MVQCSNLQEEELFQICIDFWAFFTMDILKKTNKGIFDETVMNKTNPFQDKMIMGTQGVSPNLQGSFLHANIYPKILQDLRSTLIEKMARPNEVLVMIDDNGDTI